MAFMNTISVKCSNKLCSYIGSVTVINSHTLKEKRVCPKCGFKTLTDNVVFSDRSIEELNKWVDKCSAKP